MKRGNYFVVIASAILMLNLFACTDDLMQEVADQSNSEVELKCYNVPNLHPIVSVDWLARYKNGVVTVDVRTEEEYNAGHIPGSISIPMVVPFSPWIISNELLMELPEVADLEAMLGNAGISNRSKVVLVSGLGDPPYPQAGANRAAATLNYLGFNAVSILDGGYDKWVAAGKDIATEPTVLPITSFVARPVARLFVDIDYVAASIGKKMIIDTRDEAVYLGQVVEPWALVPGHIPTAISLPAVLVWNADGTYKSKVELNKIVKRAIGNVSKNQELIIYCGVGGYTTTMYYVLSNILGYKNVRMYDGSAQEWVMYYDMEM